MSRLAPVLSVLLLISAFVSTYLWRDLRSTQQALRTERQSLLEERQLTTQLRTQLAEVRAQSVSSASQQVTVEAVPQSASNVEPPRELVAAATEAVKRQKALLDNSEYHKARVAEVRTDLKKRNPLLAKELGISEKAAETVFDILAEDQFRREAQGPSLLAANGSKPDANEIEEVKRLQKAQRQERDDTLLSMLGYTKFEQLKYIEETESARNRMVNMNTLLTQAGQPLTPDQALSFTKVMAAEQKRYESESQELRRTGRATQVSQLDRAVEGDRRILNAISSFLSAQQLETIRARFEQRQALERASGAVQTRERAAIGD